MNTRIIAEAQVGRRTWLILVLIWCMKE